MRPTARLERLRQSWIPLTPAEVLQLARDSKKRIIQSEEQLLDLVMESLACLEAKLHGETPQVFCLWDNLGKRGSKPKDEGSLSDYIVSHLKNELEDSGVILNREVEIRRRNGSARGERTDIFVQTTSTDSTGRSNVISLVVEVKGNWNEEIDTAMETQLVGRYLNEFRCHTGVYLVGCFDSTDWISSDRRRSRSRRRSIEDIRLFLGNQAMELSRDGRYCIKAFALNISR